MQGWSLGPGDLVHSGPAQPGRCIGLRQGGKRGGNAYPSNYQFPLTTTHHHPSTPLYPHSPCTPRAWKCMLTPGNRRISWFWRWRAWECRQHVGGRAGPSLTLTALAGRPSPAPPHYSPPAPFPLQPLPLQNLQAAGLKARCHNPYKMGNGMQKRRPRHPRKSWYYDLTNFTENLMMLLTSTWIF